MPLKMNRSYYIPSEENYQKKERNNPMETNLTNEQFTGTSQFKSPTFNIINLNTGSYMTAKGDGLEIKIEPLVDGDLSQIW